MVAIITPMRGGRVDYPALEGLYRIHAAASTDGVVVCGTTGESATLTHDEHEEVMQHAAAFFREELGEKAPLLVAGTGSNSTHEAVSLTRAAAELGVDAVLVITPYYNKPTPKGQIHHFTTVAEAAGETPVILYNVPGRTGLKMNLATILQLAEEVPNITAIKEASGDLLLISEIVRLAPPDFGVISGEDNLTFPLMALGGIGVISVTANILPELFHDMIHLCLEGRFEEARLLHQRQFRMTEALFFETSPIPVKTAVTWMKGTPAPGGLEWPDAGEFRPPMCEISEAGAVRLRTEMLALNLLPSQAEVS
jgi:4-hydroxy-tetrahydrodipicolinate synthase